MELYIGVVRNKSPADAMGIRRFTDVGVTFDIVLRTDASAALGVVNRRGVGKTRHIDTRELCLQNAIGSFELPHSPGHVVPGNA